LPIASYFEHPERPLEVDVGCGKGRFLLSRAGKLPNTNFLGIDRMLRRIRALDRKIVRAGLFNVRLLRMEAYYALTYLMPPAAVDTFYIYFPDPWPKKRHQEHRLFNPRFMDALARTLKPRGRMHFATDHWPYYDAVRELFCADSRFQVTDPFIPSDDEQTDFERWYIQRGPIGRLSVVKADAESAQP
jgi:tRNA (guanine-N7-)-methyltransferase